jgi:hypothetical protein
MVSGRAGLRGPGALAVLLLAGCTFGADAEPDPPRVEQSITPTQPAEPSPAPADWAATVAAVRSGVMHLSVETCTGSSSASGALVAPDLVLTAAHVVSGAMEVFVASGDTWVDASVVVSDPSTELALVRLSEPSDGHVFSLTEADPLPGSAVAVLGYPLTGEFTVTDGIVSAAGVDKTLDGFPMEDQLVITAAINYGNSGGPVVTSSGTLAGVVSSMDRDDETGERREGRGFAVSASVVAAPAIDALDPAASVPEAGCSGDLYFSIQTLPTDDVTAELVEVLWGHGEAINLGYYEEAYAQFTPAVQARIGSLDTWSAGVETSVWRSAVIESLGGSTQAPSLEVVLTTEQDETGSPSCTVRTMTYTFAQDTAAGTGWLIDSAQQHDVVACAGPGGG